MLWYLLSTIWAELLSTAYKSRQGDGALKNMTTVRGICRDEDISTIPGFLFPELYIAALSARGKNGALSDKRVVTFMHYKDPSQRVRPIPESTPAAPDSGLHFDALEDITAVDMEPAKYGGAVTVREEMGMPATIRELGFDDKSIEYRTKTGITSRVSRNTAPIARILDGYDASMNIREPEHVYSMV